MTLSFVHGPLDVAAIRAAVANPAYGAIVVFEGTVRDREESGREVVALDYEAYEPMARAETDAIAAEATERWGALRVLVAHRLGTVPAGETAVAIAVAAPHRDAAFAACAYVIGELKARAAIWKREVYRDGGSAWIANDAGERTARR